MPIDGRWELAMIETRAGVPARGGGTVRSSVSSQAWTRWFPITVRASERYKSLDKDVSYRVELRSHHSLSLEETRIVRTTDGGRVYMPVGSPEVIGKRGVQSIFVKELGKRIRYLSGDVESAATVEAAVTQT